MPNNLAGKTALPTQFFVCFQSQHDKFFSLIHQTVRQQCTHACTASGHFTWDFTTKTAVIINQGSVPHSLNKLNYLSQYSVWFTVTLLPGLEA